MKMKQVLATGAALSMALSMTPVTASAADKVDINVIAAQYGQQTADWWANFVTEFNEANPDINLNVEVVSWNDIYTVLSMDRTLQIGGIILLRTLTRTIQISILV